VVATPRRVEYCQFADRVSAVWQHLLVKTHATSVKRVTRKSEMTLPEFCATPILRFIPLNPQDAAKVAFPGFGC
jgi:hypothetical protein